MRGHAVPLESRTPIERAVSHRVRWVPAVAAAALLAAEVGVAIVWPRGDNVLYRVDDGTVQANDTIQTREGGAQLVLADGSRVEMRAQSALALERVDDGLRIRLSRGGIIVHAARQRAGHLYVQTDD
jgi:ferric-dicitrate binding protein FerR (iron transport regulator)